MSRPLKLVLLLLVSLSPFSLMAEKPGSNTQVQAFKERVLSIAKKAQTSKAPPRQVIVDLDRQANDLSLKWDQLIKSGQAKEADLSDPSSDYSEAFRVYTHLIMLTKLQAEKDQPPSREDCQSKKLQMQFDYPKNDSTPVQLSPGDQVIEALRRSICREN
jgi:hypothetical protein